MTRADLDPRRLRGADARCRAVLRHYENFTVASRLSPRHLRRDLTRVYAFCRSTDGLGDESPTPAVATARLHAWRDATEAMFAGAVPAHPVLYALTATVRAHGLPPAPFLDLIDANLQDQRVSAYEQWSDLLAYCMRSAAPVGRMVLLLNRITDETSVRLSDDVCNGLQLANFAQDVRGDAQRGRTYLLQQDIRAHGERGAVRAMCDRAHALLQSGLQLERTVPRRLRLQLALYRLGGEAILESIARAAFATHALRPVVTRSQRVGIVIAALGTLQPGQGSGVTVQAAHDG